jgi:hypothetical protein
MSDNSVSGASAGAWTPDQPLRADATDEQIEDREEYLCRQEREIARLNDELERAVAQCAALPPKPDWKEVLQALGGKVRDESNDYAVDCVQLPDGQNDNGSVVIGWDLFRSIIRASQPTFDEPPAGAALPTTTADFELVEMFRECIDAQCKAMNRTDDYAPIRIGREHALRILAALESGAALPPSPREVRPDDALQLGNIQNFLLGSGDVGTELADGALVKLTDAKGKPFATLTAGWLKQVVGWDVEAMDTVPAPFISRQPRWAEEARAIVDAPKMGDSQSDARIQAQRVLDLLDASALPTSPPPSPTPPETP